MQFAYNNSQNYIIKISLNYLLYKFDYKIYIDIVNNISERRILVVKNYIKRLY
jgi:hypothetical protein